MERSVIDGCYYRGNKKLVIKGGTMKAILNKVLKELRLQVEFYKMVSKSGDGKKSFYQALDIGDVWSFLDLLTEWEKDDPKWGEVIKSWKSMYGSVEGILLELNDFLEIFGRRKTYHSNVRKDKELTFEIWDAMISQPESLISLFPVSKINDRDDEIIWNVMDRDWRERCVNDGWKEEYNIEIINEDTESSRHDTEGFRREVVETGLAAIHNDNLTYIKTLIEEKFSEMEILRGKVALGIPVEDYHSIELLGKALALLEKNGDE